MSEQRVLAIKTSRLALMLGVGPELGNGMFQASPDLVREILDHSELVPRAAAEDDPGYKQLIPYCLLRRGDQVVCYERGREGDEGRLHGMLSCGVGGHIDADDLLTDHPLHLMGWAARLRAYHEALDREVSEEVRCRLDPKRPQRLLRGLLYDGTNSVGAVHLGLVHELWLADDGVESGEPDKVRYPGLVSLSFLPAIHRLFESWSQIVIARLLTVDTHVVQLDRHDAGPVPAVAEV